MAAHNIGVLTIYGIKKHEEKINCKNLIQERLCLIKGILITQHLSSPVGV
jgi:hypothetical protein